MHLATRQSNATGLRCCCRRPCITVCAVAHTIYCRDCPRCRCFHLSIFLVLLINVFAVASTVHCHDAAAATLQTIACTSLRRWLQTNCHSALVVAVVDLVSSSAYRSILLNASCSKVARRGTGLLVELTTVAPVLQRLLIMVSLVAELQTDPSVP